MFQRLFFCSFYCSRDGKRHQAVSTRHFFLDSWRECWFIRTAIATDGTSKTFFLVFRKLKIFKKYDIKETTKGEKKSITQKRYKGQWSWRVPGFITAWTLWTQSLCWKVLVLSVLPLTTAIRLLRKSHNPVLLERFCSKMPILPLPLTQYFPRIDSWFCDPNQDKEVTEDEE